MAVVIRIVELQHIPMPETGSRTERIQQAKEQFVPMMEAVRPTIERVNGEILDEVWINQTLKVSVPEESIPEIEAHPLVVKVSEPRIVTPD